jgi:Xaa-Pro aminopeptidase
MFDLKEISDALQRFQISGWLLYDFRGSNVLALRVLGLSVSEVRTRRFFYFVGADGRAKKLVHRIESGALDHLPGDKTVYLTWQELEAGVKHLVAGATTVAMEYSPRNGNPYVAKVDAGTVELVRSFGADVVSSGDLISYFESRWSDQQWQQHLRADRLNQQAFELAWKWIADNVRSGRSIRETDVQNYVMKFYEQNNMTTYHPPIVGVGPHSGDPHYEPIKGSDSEVKSGDFVLLDMWAKLKEPGAVYTDLTKVGYVGDSVPEKYEKIFAIVAAARDAGIARVRKAFASRQPLHGAQVDQAARDVIDQAGYGKYFIHRTGHNIGQETHGNGTHMDNLETKEGRLVLPETCFSIEPGIYLDDFGVRSEINVYVDRDQQVHITGGLQERVIPILAAY